MVPGITSLLKAQHQQSTWTITPRPLLTSDKLQAQHKTGCARHREPTDYHHKHLSLKGHVAPPNVVCAGSRREERKAQSGFRLA